MICEWKAISNRQKNLEFLDERNDQLTQNKVNKKTKETY